MWKQSAGHLRSQRVHCRFDERELSKISLFPGTWQGTLNYRRQVCYQEPGRERWKKDPEAQQVTEFKQNLTKREMRGNSKCWVDEGYTKAESATTVSWFPERLKLDRREAHLLAKEPGDEKKTQRAQIQADRKAKQDRLSRTKWFLRTLSWKPTQRRWQPRLLQLHLSRLWDGYWACIATERSQATGKQTAKSRSQWHRMLT